MLDYQCITEVAVASSRLPNTSIRNRGDAYNSSWTDD